MEAGRRPDTEAEWEQYFSFGSRHFAGLGVALVFFVLEAGRGPGQGQSSLWAVSLVKVGEALACFVVFLFFCCLYLRFGLMGGAFWR